MYGDQTESDDCNHVRGTGTAGGAAGGSGTPRMTITPRSTPRDGWRGGWRGGGNGETRNLVSPMCGTDPSRGEFRQSFPPYLDKGKPET